MQTFWLEHSTNCKVYIGIKDYSALQGLQIPSKDLMGISKLRIPSQLRQRMRYNFRNAGSYNAKNVKSTQINPTGSGENNSDSNCSIIDGVTTVVHDPQCTLPSENDLLFQKGNSDISPDTEHQVISQCNSHEMNAVNSQYNDSLGFNLLESADERMIVELI